jgi:hypothetical protein
MALVRGEGGLNMEGVWNEAGREMEVPGEKPVIVPLCPSHIARGLMWDQTGASGVSGRLPAA